MDENIQEMYQKARRAFETIEDWPQEKVDEMVAAVGWEWQKDENARFLAKLALDEGKIGVYGAALGVRERIGWLQDSAGLAAGALLLIVPDLAMRYARILAESPYPYGFWEWLFRRER